MDHRLDLINYQKTPSDHLYFIHPSKAPAEAPRVLLQFQIIILLSPMCSMFRIDGAWWIGQEEWSSNDDRSMIPSSEWYKYISTQQSTWRAGEGVVATFLYADNNVNHDRTQSMWLTGSSKEFYCGVNIWELNRKHFLPAIDLHPPISSMPLQTDYSQRSRISI